MRHTALMAAVLFASTLPAAAAPLSANEDASWTPLFNGRDFSGWVRVNTPASTWTMQDGMIVCSGKPIGEIRTERMYQNFVLEVEWRHLVPKGNSGIFVWADDITARGQPFHRGVEVQVLENAYGNTRHYTTHGDIFPIHGATMTPVNGRGGSRAFPTEERSRPAPEWNHYRVVCNDGDISLDVNGKTVTHGTSCVPRKGYICLESEGGVVHFRNLRIRERPATPIDPAHVAIANRGYRCLYTGLDLSGWTVPEKARALWAPRDWILAFGGDGPTGEEAAIATEEAFGDLGFVLDLRLPKGSRPARVQLRGPQAAIDIDPADPLVGGHLAKPGEWNRLEGTLRGDRLTLDVNGRRACEDRPVSGIPARGPIRIVPDSPLELANPYVRGLEAK
jgi:hypothetical protein